MLTYPFKLKQVGVVDLDQSNKTRKMATAEEAWSASYTDDVFH